MLDSRTDLDDVKGWFGAVDQAMFRFFLDYQDSVGTTGDLVELGVYLGKSSILIGDYLRSGETFTVVDTFGTEPGEDLLNAQENARSYPTLSRTAFEENYQKFHQKLPEVYTALSSSVTQHVPPDSVRFMHIDASHLYEHVATDTKAAQSLLCPDGIVVYDDYRAAHTPGVAAALWEAVANEGLKPIVLTPNKAYGTWGDPEPYLAALPAFLEDHPNARRAPDQVVAGHKIIRVRPPWGQGQRVAEVRRQAGAAQAERVQRQAAKIKRQQRQISELQARVDALAAVSDSAAYRLGRAALTSPRRLLRSRQR